MRAVLPVVHSRKRSVPRTNTSRIAVGVVANRDLLASPPPPAFHPDHSPTRTVLPVVPERILGRARTLQPAVGVAGDRVIACYGPASDSQFDHPLLGSICQMCHQGVVEVRGAKTSSRRRHSPPRRIGVSSNVSEVQPDHCPLDCCKYAERSI